MNILYTVNDKFVPQVATGICSICENNKHIKNINFYLFSMGITKSNKDELIKFVNKYKRKLTIIEIGELNQYIDFKIDTLGWNPVAVSRLFLDKILPNNIKKILYLDGDTIVRGSLEELWNLDMDRYVIGASIEPTVDKKRIEQQLGMVKVPYYNSGVLLIDLEKWREEKTGSQIIDFYRKKGGELFAIDQDAINGCLNGNIFTISPKYNFYNVFTQYPYKMLCKLMEPVPYVSEKIFNDAKKNPIIIHYLGEERPWRKGNTHKYKEDYLKYLDMTPWKNAPVEKGWELYFVCWKVFNFVSSPFPMIRYKIINYLIPHFMNYRSKQLIKNKEK